MYNNYFRNKCILITGGSSGIGKAAAISLKSEGAKVGIISNNQEELNNMPDGFDLHKTDIRIGNEVNLAVNSFEKKHGKIDALINSAGVSLWEEFVKMDESFWDLIYDVNVKGTFLVSQAVAKQMIKQGSGFILNIASMSGLKSGMPKASAYASSKWAIVGFSRNLHLELKTYGIKVACLCPGSTKTVLHEKANSPNIDQMLEPDDIAKTILFMLAAPNNGHIQLLAQPALFENWQ